MKPPLRARLAPARFLTGPGAAAAGEEPERSRPAWSVREKRALLAALRAQAALGLPELQARPLRERLPRRSEAEILSFLARLRGRAAREAVSTEHRLCLEQQRRRRSHLPSPIEVWLELAQVLGEGLEEATSAALSQVLTVAATEPLTLLHSLPPQPTGGGERGEGSVQEDPSPSSPAPPPPPRVPPPPPGDFTVDFQKVYEYLGVLCRGGRGDPTLPPGEAAVLLTLLSSLPPQLGSLPLSPLYNHFRGVYSDLTTPQPPPRDLPPPQPPPGTPQTPPNWRGVGLCPLNFFLLPLGLLGPSG